MRRGILQMAVEGRLSGEMDEKIEPESTPFLNTFDPKKSGKWEKERDI